MLYFGMFFFFFFFQAEDGIRDLTVTGVQTCALPILALEWSDVDLGKRQLCVQRSDWKGHVTTTKGGRLRYVPLTVRLAAALSEQRHPRRCRVLCQSDGSPLTQKIVQDHVRRSVRRTNLTNSGVHRLRHTFCSHLAMRGAPARAIQELAGHEDLATTQRYMHLSPAALDSAIRLLDRLWNTPEFWRHHVGDGEDRIRYLQHVV